MLQTAIAGSDDYQRDGLAPLSSKINSIND